MSDTTYEKRELRTLYTRIKVFKILGSYLLHSVLANQRGGGGGGGANYKCGPS